MRGARKVHQCQRSICRNRDEHPDLEYHYQVNLLHSRLDEQPGRLCVKSLFQDYLVEVAFIPSSSEAFVLDPDLLS